MANFYINLDQQEMAHLLETLRNFKEEVFQSTIGGYAKGIRLSAGPVDFLFIGPTVIALVADSHVLALEGHHRPHTVYITLDYVPYKALEAAVTAGKVTEHKSVPGYAHISLRLPVGETILEFHRPAPVMNRDGRGAPLTGPEHTCISSRVPNAQSD